MKYPFLSLLILSIIFSNCKEKSSTNIDVSKWQTEYQSIIDSIYHENLDAVGIMVHIESPKNKISWSGCTGHSNKDQKTILDPDQPALIASSIKTYISATILRLEEKGSLSIEESIKKHLSNQTTLMFENDGYDFDKIKIKHLLSHTSGIKDYADQEYIDWIDKNQKHRWTRNEQLKLTVDKGDPLGGPESVFSYADANYLLCTEIIETTSNKPFYTAIRELLQYQKFGFDNTWFPTLEEANNKTKKLVHQYWGLKNWDSYDHDISWDLYGGGGIATTTEELAKFSYNLFDGKIIRDNTILNKIFTKIIPADGKDMGYLLGIGEGSSNGFSYYGHGGFWGTTFVYLPELETSIAIYVLDRDKGNLRPNITDELVKQLAKQLDRFEELTKAN